MITIQKVKYTKIEKAYPGEKHMQVLTGQIVILEFFLQLLELQIIHLKPLHTYKQFSITRVTMMTLSSR